MCNMLPREVGALYPGLEYLAPIKMLNKILFSVLEGLLFSHWFALKTCKRFWYQIYTF